MTKFNNSSPERVSCNKRLIKDENQSKIFEYFRLCLNIILCANVVFGIPPGTRDFISGLLI